MSGSPEIKRHNDQQQPPPPPVKLSKPTATNVYQDPLPVLAVSKQTVPKPTAPRPPPAANKPKRPSMNASAVTVEDVDDWEVFEDDLTSKTYNTKTPSPRHSVDNTNNINIKKQPMLPPGGGKGLVLDLSQVKLKPTPKAAPRILKSPSGDNNITTTSASTPRAMPRVKKDSIKKTVQTPVTPIDINGIDDIGQNMDNIIAGLDDRLNDIQDNYVDESQFPTSLSDNVSYNEKVEKPIPVKKPSITHKRPILPPKPPSKDGLPTPTERKASVPVVSPFTPLSLNKILWKKLRSEGVQIHETPYTTTVSCDYSLSISS